MNIVRTHDLNDFLVELGDSDLKIIMVPRWRVDTILGEAEGCYEVVVTFTVLLEDVRGDRYLLEYRVKAGDYREHSNEALHDVSGKEEAERQVALFKTACEKRGVKFRQGKLEVY